MVSKQHVTFCATQGCTNPAAIVPIVDIYNDFAAPPGSPPPRARPSGAKRWPKVLGLGRACACYVPALKCASLPCLAVMSLVALAGEASRKLASDQAARGVQQALGSLSPATRKRILVGVIHHVPVNDVAQSRGMLGMVMASFMAVVGSGATTAHFSIRARTIETLAARVTRSQQPVTGWADACVQLSLAGVIVTREHRTVPDQTGRGV